MPWRTVPFGYCIRDGKVAVEEGEAAKLKKAFENYIGGTSSLRCSKPPNKSGRRGRSAWGGRI